MISKGMKESSFQSLLKIKMKAVKLLKSHKIKVISVQGFEKWRTP